jgi:hypothetical protein
MRQQRYVLIDQFNHVYYEGEKFIHDDAVDKARELSQQERLHGVWMRREDSLLIEMLYPPVEPPRETDQPEPYQAI